MDGKYCTECHVLTIKNHIHNIKQEVIQFLQVKTTAEQSFFVVKIFLYSRYVTYCFFYITQSTISREIDDEDLLWINTSRCFISLIGPQAISGPGVIAVRQRMKSMNSLRMILP